MRQHEGVGADPGSQLARLRRGEMTTCVIRLVVVLTGRAFSQQDMNPSTEAVQVSRGASVGCVEEIARVV